MKFVLVMLLAFLVACGGQTNPNPEPNPTPDDEPMAVQLPKAISPVGDPISGMGGSTLFIGGEGGTVLSSDGRVSVVVPPKAFQNSSFVSIEPISATAPNDLSPTYRISTAAFETGNAKAPIFLEFVVNEGTEVATPDLAVARQTNTGQWQINPNLELQSQNANPQRRVRIKLEAAGDYAIVSKYKLHPSRASVLIGNSLPLTVVRLESLDPNNFSNLNISPIVANNWSVENIPSGNQRVGQLIASSQANQNIFKAPSKVPSPNPVTIRTQVLENGRSIPLSSTVTILDSKGWIDVYSQITFNKSLNTPDLTENWQVNVVGQYLLKSFKFDAYAPTVFSGTDYDGGVAGSFALGTKSNGTALIKYSAVKKSTCICTPKQGDIITNIEYTFSAANDLDDLNFLGVTGEVKKNGQFPYSPVKIQNAPIIAPSRYISAPPNSLQSPVPVQSTSFQPRC